ncbi:aspartate aminotransferase family protein [Shimia sp. MMG029]|uniref:aspartate aminotransferase family protein n=1 Tax=Shimia sp. MMG029 TaxID=3021978 RepID=UPI0022FF32CF|nr:aspartate aminotransferase family protein [Shimia sp. MMG029]MDA5556645.1 aspartate aminotransferase family protein [Shimia sp. MMG029]
MSFVFPRHSKKTLPTVARGEGPFLYDTSGKAYFDGSGGAAVSCLGHSDPAVMQAIKAQVDAVAFAHTGFFTSEPAEALAEKLVENAPKGLDRVYLVSGGSEAMESAIKLARQYAFEKGEGHRRHVVARRQSYHGNTLGALATGGNEWRRAAFAPLLMDTHHISPCYAYRGQEIGETAFDYGQRVANELQDAIDELGAENVLAFVAEPVVGATAGAVPPVEGYFKRIREICDANGVLLILDEVMCGMGRTGTLFACEQDDVRPDICAVAKGLGAGYQPIGAMLCSAEIYSTIRDGSGFFQHGHTYNGHPTAAAASLAVLTRLVDDGIVNRVAPMGAKLRQALAERFEEHANIGDIRGRGLFLGLELVADRETKAPFDPALGIAAKLKTAAFEAGLICYPMGGTIDGQNGAHVLLAPPFIMEDAHIPLICDALETAFNAVLPST